MYILYLAFIVVYHIIFYDSIKLSLTTLSIQLTVISFISWPHSQWFLFWHYTLSNYISQYNCLNFICIRTCCHMWIELLEQLHSFMQLCGTQGQFQYFYDFIYGWNTLLLCSFSSAHSLSLSNPLSLFLAVALGCEPVSCSASISGCCLCFAIWVGVSAFESLTHGRALANR